MWSPAKVCPRNVITMKEKKAFVIDRDACLECGACAKNCAFEAITGDFGVGCAAAMISGLLRFAFIGLSAHDNDCTTTLTFDKKAARSGLFILIR